MRIRRAPRILVPSILRDCGVLTIWLWALLFLCISEAGRAAEKQVVHGNVPAAIARLDAVDRLDPAQRLNLAIGLPVRNGDALAELLRELSDPGSPNYRKYLTPAQFTERFGPTDADYQTVIRFAKTHGLTVTATHPNRLILDVQGKVADIESALQVKMRTYRHPTEARQFYAPNSDPTLDLAVPIVHISGLDNYFLPHPNLHPMPAGGAGANAAPNSGTGPGGAYAAGDFRAAYVPGTSLTGAGQSVGLLQFDGYYASDIAAYRTQFGLPNIPLVNVAIDGGVSVPGSGNSEVCLDIEMVMSMAPGVSTIYVYEAPNPSPWVDLLSRMANDNLSKQLSCSWGGGGPDASAETIFQQMAAQGQSFFNASGDSDAFTSAVAFPADSPNITQVGGTTLTTTGAGGSYVSETVWNWGGGTGSSGGISTFYTIPAWQQGINMTASQGSTSLRNIPDVALTGDNVYVNYNNGGSGAFGGTSCAAPLWAAFTALVNQQAAANSRPPVGFLTPAIYTIGKNSSYATTFHDTTTGNNFNSSSPTKYAAVSGYDLCTGWGTPNGPALIASLAGPPDPLQVTYAAFASTGQLGGPFTPASQTYTLTNTGTTSLDWTASKGQPWTTLSAMGGTLAPGAFTTVTWSLTAAANALSAGNYSDVLTMTNSATGVSQILGLSLTITPPRAAYFPLDTDPGWTRQGEWAFGKPLGGGGLSFGHPDPTSGATGTNVFGINLSGDYSATVAGPFYLTTAAINLANYSGTQLRFKRWLNTDYVPWSEETIDVSNNGTTWTNIFTNPSTGPIADSAWTTMQYDISAVADKHSTVYIRWGHQIGTTGVFPNSGWNIDDIEILGSPVSAVTLQLSASNVTEGASPVTATLGINPIPTADTIVTLSSSDPASASVPANMTILAGQSSVTFPVTIGDDALLNGTRNVIITAAASGYTSGTVALSVNDNETAILSVSAPGSASEGAGTVQGQVSVSAAPVSPVTVSLASSDSTALQVPATATIPAGQTSANFTIAIVDDTKINGTHPATITAHVANWTDGSATVNILDNESTNLAVLLPASVTEGGTGTGTVSISGTLTTALTVALSSNNVSRLTVPATVTISAGATFGTFTVTAPNNALTDGTASVTITASASGFIDGTGTTSVLDNDVHHFTVASIASPQGKGLPFSVTLTAKDVNGVTMASYAGTPALSASGTGGADAILPTTTTAFTSGVWTGNVTVNTFDTNVVLTVNDGAGHTGSSNAFTVATGPVHHFAWSPLPASEYTGIPFSATVTAQDANNNTVTSFTGAVNLSGYTGSGVGSSIVITEVNPNTPDEIEFMNVSTAPVNVSGWTIYVYDIDVWPGAKIFTIPAGTTCAAGQIFRLQEYGTAPGAFPVFFYGDNIDWTSDASSEIAVLLRDSSGNAIDFMCAALGNPASITSPQTIPATQWTGATIAAPADLTFAYARIGNSDGNKATDWTTATPGLGTVNPGLTTPFPGSISLVTISPTVSANFSNGTWTGNMTVMQPATQMKLRADDGFNHLGDSTAFNVTGLAPNTLVLSLNSNTVIEGSAPVTATLTTSPAPASDTMITLGSSDSASASVPTSVTLPAGQTSVTFPVTIGDDALLNGNRNVVVTASAGGYTSGTATLTVNDNETATLTVSAPGSVSEGAGTAQGTMSVSTAPTYNATVSLTSSDTTALQVPATATIPAGQTSAPFTITIIDDTKINGTHPATITAHVANWTDGSATVNILDNESTNLSVTLPSSVTEGGTGTGTVSISGTLPAALTVSLSSNNTSRLTVPATTTISAGATSATFTLTAPNNALTDGTASATVTASASGFTAGTGTTSVLDDDVHHFTVASIASPQIKGVPFSVTLTAKDINGVTIASFAGIASLSATGAGGPDSLSPPTTTVFTNGVWAGNVTVNGFDTNVVLTASDGAGHAGSSNAFTVGVGPLHHFAWNPLPATENIGAPFNANLTAQDAGNNTVTSFTGTVNLSGYVGNGVGSDVIITEIDTSDNDAIEFMNTSSAPKNISGWRVSIYDWSIWPSASVSFIIPTGTVCAANQIFLLRENGASPGTFPNFYTGTNIFWNNNATGNPVALLLQDASGNVVDFICAFDAVPSQITQPISIPSTAWVGAPIAANLDMTKTFQRTGTADHNNNTDWTVGAGTLGIQNPGLTTPFPGPQSPVTISPTISGTFAGGMWTGNITVPQPATQMRLHADDGAGHTGESTPFDAVGTMILGVTPADGLSATGQAGGPFAPSSASYTVSNTGNISMPWTASNGANWLTVSPAGGILGPGATIVVTATINNNAAALSTGSYSDTITFTNTGSGVGNTTRPVALAVAVPTPILGQMPAYIGGTSNTVTWNSVLGADLYEVQSASDAAFTNPTSSGWITPNSYTFASLANGATYYYRVHARHTNPGASGVFTQTTQVDFNTDTKTSVTATAGGDVILTAVPGSEVTGRILNPSFESGLANWTTTASSNMSTQVDNYTAYPPLPTQGTEFANIYTIDSSFHTVGDSCTLSQNVDFTGIATFTFDAMRTWGNAVSFFDGARVVVRVDGQTLWSTTTPGGYVNQSLDVSGYTGIHVLELREEVTVTGTFSSQWASFDNLRTNAAGGYAPTGNLVSPLIAPTPLSSWGQLSFTRDVTATGTLLTLDVLDANGALLASNVPSGTVLQSIPAVAAQAAIKLRANLSTSSIPNTPKLSDWSVTYIQGPPSTVDSAWSATASSTQDAVAPVVNVTAPVSLSTTRSKMIIQGTASDLSGVHAVSLDGTAATSSDGFAHWNVTLQNLQAGLNTVTLLASDNAVPPNVANVPIQITGITPADGNNNKLPDAWETQYGVIGGPTDDFHHNGLQNILAYAFNIDPNAVDHSLLPAVSWQINPVDQLKYLTFSYRRLLDDIGLVYSVELSPDLLAWNPAGLSIEEANPPVPNVDGLTETVTVRVKPALNLGAPDGFIHLRVIVNY